MLNIHHFDDMMFHGLVQYLDDILVYFKSQYKYDQRLQHVVDLIEKSGLSVNSSNCFFNTKRLKLMCYLMSGIETNNNKIIEGFSVSTCIHQEVDK